MNVRRIIVLSDVGGRGKAPISKREQPCLKLRSLNFILTAINKWISKDDQNLDLEVVMI